MARRQFRDSSHLVVRVFSAVLCMSCLSSPHGASSEDAVQIPDVVFNAADQHLRSRVGELFHLAYFRLDPDDSRYIKPRANATASAQSDKRYLQPYYYVAYDFRMPQHGFVDERVHCDTRADGSLIECQAVPDCVAEPEECRFTVDEERARQIALGQGLAAGLGEWEFSFHWNYGHQTYIWTVLNTLEETPGGATGEMVMIDANSGVAYSRTSWFRHDCG